MNISRVLKVVGTIYLAIIFAAGSFYLLSVDMGQYFNCDFLALSNALQGDTSQFFYPYWFLWLLYPFTSMPEPLGITIWSLMNLAGVYYGTKTFGGKWWLAIFSFQMAYTLWVGNVVGFVLGGAAFLFSSLEMKKPVLGGLGLLLCTIKPQLGVPIAVGIIVLSNLNWIARLKTLIIPGFGTILSLFIYPGWPNQLLETLQNTPPNDAASISLWPIFGPIVLMLWIPVFLPGMSKRDRLILIACAQAVTLPYYQQTDLLAIFLFPLGFAPILGNLGFLSLHFGWTGVEFLSLIPLSIILFLVSRNLHSRKRTRTQKLSKILNPPPPFKAADD